MSKHVNPQSHHNCDGERFTPKPEEYDSATCGLCGTNMDVQRNVFGPTSFGGAMLKRGHLHDWFECPNRREDWHIQVKKILREAQKTSSTALQELLEKDAKKVLKTRKATKKVYD